MLGFQPVNGAAGSTRVWGLAKPKEPEEWRAGTEVAEELSAGATTSKEETGLEASSKRACRARTCWRSSKTSSSRCCTRSSRFTQVHSLQQPIPKGWPKVALEPNPKQPSEAKQKLESWKEKNSKKQADQQGRRMKLPGRKVKEVQGWNRAHWAIQERGRVSLKQPTQVQQERRDRQASRRLDQSPGHSLSRRSASPRPLENM